MIRSSAQLTPGPETRRLMREVFEVNEPVESAIILRMATVRERRRLAQGEARVRRRYAFAGALAALCFGGTALAVGVSAGFVEVEFFPVHLEHKSSGQDALPASLAPGKDPRTNPADEALRALEPSEVPRAAAEPSPAVLPTIAPRTVPPRTVAPPTTAPPAAKTPANDASVGQNEQMGSDVSNVPQSGASASAANWQEVAEAMRAGQDARAREAVTPLTESLDRETRDSAELVKLRIELGSHREGKLSANASQRARLERLAQDGASPSIRVSARRLLERVNPIGIRDFSEIDDSSR